MTRCGIDTNVILRLIIHDEPEKRCRAAAFSDGLGRSSAGAIRMLFRVRGLDVKAHDLVVTALAPKSLDAGREDIITFDQTAASLIPGMDLRA